MTKTEYAEYLNTAHWRERRLTAIERARSTCQHCELPRWLAEMVYDQDLHVHHLTYATLGREDDEDLQVLCRRCHEIETFGRSQLREVEAQYCDRCMRTHWDRRAAYCEFCVELIEWPRTLAGAAVMPEFASDKERESVNRFVDCVLLWSPR